MTQTYSPTKKLFEILDYLIDDHVGVIKYVKELPRESGAPNFFHFYSKACNTESFVLQKNFDRAGGASSTRSNAAAKAVGEAIERYCSAIFYSEELPLTSFRNASFQCVHPIDFALYRPEQYKQQGFPYREFVDDTPVCWTPAQDLFTHKTFYLPASMVYLPYAIDEGRGEAAIGQRISTGLACHCTREEAAISAICEVVERDAFTITWQASMSMPKIRIESLSEDNRDLVARFESTGRQVTLVNITLDTGIPTCLAILHGVSLDSPALVFAASTSLCPEIAIKKSLEELAHTWRLAHQLKNHSGPLEPGIEYENVARQDDHVHLYCDYRNLPLSQFIFSSQKEMDFQEMGNLSTENPTEDLQLLVNLVSAINHKVLISDLTTPDIRDLGLTVVRAVIPGFHPLFIGHRLRALGGFRLWSVPQKLGYPGITPVLGDNPGPHPYP